MSKLLDDGLVFHKKEIDFVPIMRQHLEYTSEQVAVKELGDRVVNQMKLVPVDVAKRDDGVKPSDFALENLIATGYDLKSYSMRNDSFSSIRDIESVLDAFSKSENNFVKSDISE